MASRIWVTADTHFSDPTAIERFARPFASTEDMDDRLIEEINHSVAADDQLLHLGDVFGNMDWKRRATRKHAQRTLARIRCTNIRLITGNHDPDARSFTKMFTETSESASWKLRTPHGDASLRVVCHHYPMRQWRGMWKGALHFHGHAHGTLPEFGRSIDVGVDCWKFAPVLLDDFIARLLARPVPTEPCASPSADHPPL